MLIYLQPRKSVRVLHLRWNHFDVKVYEPSLWIFIEIGQLSRCDENALGRRGRRNLNRRHSRAGQSIQHFYRFFAENGCKVGHLPVQSVPWHPLPPPLVFNGPIWVDDLAKSATHLTLMVKSPSCEVPRCSALPYLLNARSWTH